MKNVLITKIINPFILLFFSIQSIGSQRLPSIELNMSSKSSTKNYQKN